MPLSVPARALSYHFSAIFLRTPHPIMKPRKFLIDSTPYAAQPLGEGAVWDR